MPETAFLQPDNEQIRHQIRGVLDSYSHEWDLLSELLQNSIDAIRDKSSGKGHISLLIDAPKKLIRVRDNGSGIDPNEISTLMRPFGTNKISKPRQIGEKGVGLKFVMFSSSKFKLSTKNRAGECTATVTDAAAWLNSASGTASDTPLLMTLTEESTFSDVGTEVEIVLNESDHPIFNFSFVELLFLLRTRTAAGDTGCIWDNPFDADVEFTHIDKSEAKKVKEFECRYLLPIETLGGSEYISVDEFENWLTERDRSDAEKRRKLFNKIVYAKGKKWQGGRDIRYWSCFVPRREMWKVLSQKFGIEFPEQEDTSLTMEEQYGLGFNGGFATSTKGMPTGITIEMKPRGSAGYVPNFFIIVDDPALRFDIGRKSIQGRQQGMLRDIAYDNFRDYINKTRKYMGGTVDADTGGWDRDEVFDEIEELPDLASSVSRFVKRPNSQEATVAALFFEQLGRGALTDLSPLISGYKGRYDLYAKWGRRRVVLEFKFDLVGLFRDFTDERKLFDEINAVVVWEVTEADRRLAARHAITIEDIQESSFSSRERFPGATKTLNLGDVNPISVVELRSLLGA